MCKKTCGNGQTVNDDRALERPPNAIASASHSRPAGPGCHIIAVRYKVETEAERLVAPPSEFLMCPSHEGLEPEHVSMAEEDFLEASIACDIGSEKLENLEMDQT